ncbi:MAG: hypothetical protein ACHQCF_02110 [Solirubrobacterales bacterium]
MSRARPTFRSSMPAVAATLVLLVSMLALHSDHGSASPGGEIVIHGATGSGSRLQLTVRGHRILARGLIGASPQICRVTVAHRLATCPVGSAQGIEVDMGPFADEVDVLSRLPLPLTVHLGAGSDRFIGNGERDTCYSEGTRRNRCIGGGGRDICITGPGNSDCIGGPGNDVCVQGGGSDGCWGGPGNDVCRMGAGDDGCHGGPGNDRLYGGPGSDQLYGGPGFDFCDGGPGIGRSQGCEAAPRH